MPTAEIPFGSGDDLHFTDPLTTQPYWLGSVQMTRNGVDVDYHALIAAHTISPTGATSTDDTTSYLTADNTAFDDDMDTTYPPPSGVDSEFYVQPKARQDSAFGLPAGATNLAGVVIYVARSTVPLTFTPDVYCYDNTGAATCHLGVSMSGVAAVGADWTRYELAITTSLASVQPQLEAALEARQSTILLTPLWTPTPAEGALGVQDVAYMAVRLSWDNPGTVVGAANALPFIRHRQRGDGFGMSSAPRAIQNSTQQASLRNFGTI